MFRIFKRKVIKYWSIIKPTTAVGIFFIFIFFLLSLLAPLYTFTIQNKISPRFILNLILSKEKELPIRKYQDRTNIVLLGMAGEENDGFDLTDTIIFLSLDFTKQDILMLSIPRDLWLDSLRAKINSAYHYGEKKKKGGGPILAKAAVEEVVGQPIHYALTLDFSGFKYLIDMVGGIDIFVEKGFTDSQYPIKGKEEDLCGGDPTFACRYETVHFKSGWQHMDGEEALKYVRSRRAEGEEGTDFARDRRQQQVIVALKNKLQNYPFWKNPNKLREVFYETNEIVQTDMNWSEKISLIRSFWNLRNQSVRQAVLDSGDEEKGKEGFLITPPSWQYNGIWVLVPRTGNFEEIQKYIACQLEDPDCSIKP